MIIHIKVKPKAKESKILIDKNKEIVVHLTQVPENGKANKELIQILSKNLKVPQANIEIISGLTSKFKRINITGFLTKEDIIEKLNLYIQNKIF